MIEFAVVLAILLLIVGSGSLLLLKWQTLVLTAGWLLAVGAAVGVPTGVLYHVRLYRALAPQQLLPARWYWNPVHYHDLLEEGAERRSVMRWFWLGATGFVVIALGVVALCGAVAKVYLHP